MAIKFRKQAIKLLERASPEDVLKIQAQLKQILTGLEGQGLIPFTDLGRVIK